jgi:hypothetical protein
MSVEQRILAIYAACCKDWERHAYKRVSLPKPYLKPTEATK